MEKKEIEDMIKADAESYMQQMWRLYSLFSNGTEQDTEEWRFEQGFLSALGYVGDCLGLDLVPISDEDKEKIDSIVEELKQGNNHL